MLQQLDAMSTYTSRMLLTIACPAGKSLELETSNERSTHKGRQNYEKLRMKEMDTYVDLWNLMAYDYAGSWDSVAGHQANVFPHPQNPTSTPFSTQSAVEAYRASGIAASKIIIGMPLYGRAFKNTDGPGKPFAGIGEGSWEQGVWDYKVLPQVGAREHFDEIAKASYSFDSQKRLMISYDSEKTAIFKAEYIKKQARTYVSSEV